MEITAAILLRKRTLTETSLVVTWLSENYGRLKTVAKGARRPRSPFSGRLDLFYECEIQFVRSGRSDLHTLREVMLRTRYDGLRIDAGRVGLAAYFVELLELVTEPEHPAPELFELFQRALAYLNKTPGSVRALVHFETELARLLGIQNPTITPAMAIGRVYHRLPTARTRLMKTFAADKPA